MPATGTISHDKLMRLIGTPGSPILIDVRNDEDFGEDTGLVPSSNRKSHATVDDWGRELAGRNVVVICHHGGKLGYGTAAWLRHHGVDAVVLEDGIEGWKAAGLPLVPQDKLPPRDILGRTVWVTRARPKIDRIACPWLVRRFIDPSAVFLFVLASEVEGVASRFNATPFDIENTFWSHRGDRCTFDTMIEEFGLATDPLLKLATIVRAADTARLDQSPEAPGLLAASLGLSRMFSEDLPQLEAGMLIYDAFYRWCRDATDETHNWPTSKVKS
jgi:rhodanese-related sulfurtransferase